MLRSFLLFKVWQEKTPSPAGLSNSRKICQCDGLWFYSLSAGGTGCQCPVSTGLWFLKAALYPGLEVGWCGITDPLVHWDMGAKINSRIISLQTVTSWLITSSASSEDSGKEERGKKGAIKRLGKLQIKNPSKVAFFGGGGNKILPCACTANHKKNAIVNIIGHQRVVVLMELHLHFEVMIRYLHTSVFGGSSVDIMGKHIFFICS